MIRASIKSHLLATAASLILFTVLSADASGQPPVTGSLIFGSNYISGLYEMDAGGANIFAIVPFNNFNGCNCSQQINSAVFEATQARSTSTIAFASGHDQSGQQRIYVMNGDGTGIQQITFHDPTSYPRSHVAPAISPDGSRVAFVNNEAFGTEFPGCETTNFGALDIINIDGTGLTQVIGTTKPDPRYCNLGNVQEAAWSPDGSKLVFRHDGVSEGYGGAGPNCGTGIFIANADGSGIQNIACDNNTYPSQRGLDWSPDGTRIIALLGGGSVWNQYTAQGAFINSIPATGNQMGVVRYSPDSTQLAYVKNDLGVNKDYFVTLDLSGNMVQSIDVRTLYGLVPDMGESFWWNTDLPIGTLNAMTLAPDPINVCPDAPAQLQTATFDSNGTQVTAGWIKAVSTGTSGDGASLTIDTFGTLSFTPGRSAGTFTLQLFQAAAGVSSNTVTVNTSPVCSGS